MLVVLARQRILADERGELRRRDACRVGLSFSYKPLPTYTRTCDHVKLDPVARHIQILRARLLVSENREQTREERLQQMASPIRDLSC